MRKRREEEKGKSIKPLAIVLLLGVVFRHTAATWLPGYSQAAWFYMLGGLWEFTLCGLILWQVLGYPLTKWARASVIALIIGMSEAFQMTFCRACIGDIREVPTGVNLCDHITGLPIGAVMMGLYILLISWHIGRHHAKPS